VRRKGGRQKEPCSPWIFKFGIFAINDRSVASYAALTWCCLPCQCFDSSSHQTPVFVFASQNELHSLFVVECTRPVFRRNNAIDLFSRSSANAVLTNTHVGLRDPTIVDGKVTWSRVSPAGQPGLIRSTRVNALKGVARIARASRRKDFFNALKGIARIFSRDGPTLDFARGAESCKIHFSNSKLREKPFSTIKLT